MDTRGGSAWRRNGSLPRGAAPAGRILDALECRLQTNRLRVHCCPPPINPDLSQAAHRAASKSYFHFFINRLTQLKQRCEHRWHGARTIGQRADAHTFNPTQRPSLSTSGEPK
jgi:hypothetical protein